MSRLLQIAHAARIVLQARLRNKYTWHEAMIDQCIELGGVYIKFIQMLAVHETTKHLVRGVSAALVYEYVPYEPIDVSKELGPAEYEFASIDFQPFAGGSYGQVYRGKLLNGEDVIIKILRPSVRRTLRQDLRILNSIATVISWFSKSAIVDTKAIAQEFSRTTMSETDYKREAINAEWQREYFTKRGTLVVPRSYPQLGSKHVLVQQYVAGISVAEAMTKQLEGKRIDQVVYEATGSNIWQQLDQFGEELLTAMLHAEYQMVDPHPGNIRLLPDNKVALIDFGMISEAPSNRAAIVNVVGEYVKIYENRFDAGSFALAMLAFLDVELHDALQIVVRQHLTDYSSSLEKFIHDYFETQAKDSLTQHYILERRVSRLFDQVINRGNRLGIRLSKENVMQQRSMNMFLSMVRAIGEAHDGAVNFSLLYGITSRVYNNALRQGFSRDTTPDMSEEQAFEVTANWLTMIAEKDRELYGFIVKGSFA